MTIEFELTKEEKNAIASLKRLAKRWPDSLWLFAGSGHLCVMRTDENGVAVHTVKGGGYDPDYLITTVDIPNEGGDWD